LGAADPGLLAFGREWLSLGMWPSGPAWFIWLLLAVDGLAVGVNRCAPDLLGGLGRRVSKASRRPMAFFAAFVIVSVAAYLPMLIAFGAGSWVTVGPFAAQSSRFLHYGLYFFAGVAVGACDFSHGLVARDGRLARRWVLWVVAALSLFALNVVLVVAMSPSGAASWVQPLVQQLIRGLGFVFCCATISFAMLAVFRRFANRHTIVFDSLSRNAYGIYLVHYGFVVWLQYALLPAALPATAKAAMVVTMALALSWGTTAALRQIRPVARII
jgi:surface polysaccharide O-acyltransferase-like enzyme